MIDNSIPSTRDCRSHNQINQYFHCRCCRIYADHEQKNEAHAINSADRSKREDLGKSTDDSNQSNEVDKGISRNESEHHNGVDMGKTTENNDPSNEVNDGISINESKENTEAEMPNDTGHSDNSIVVDTGSSIDNSNNGNQGAMVDGDKHNEVGIGDSNQDIDRNTGGDMGDLADGGNQREEACPLEKTWVSREATKAKRQMWVSARETTGRRG